MATKPTKPVPAPQVFTPVPQRSDRANFAERGDKMMTSLPPMVDGVNENVDYVGLAVDFIDLRADEVIDAKDSVDDGVRIVEDALEAIQAGPVSSVNSQSGVVVVNWENLPGRNPVVADINSTALKSDIYCVNSSTTGTRPTGFTGDALLAVSVFGSIIQQRYIDPNSKSEFVRYNSGSSWGFWIRTSMHSDAAVSTTGALDFWKGNYFTLTVAGAVTISINDVLNSAFYSDPDRQIGCVIEINFTSGSVAFTNAVKWPNGVAPTFTGGKKYMLVMQREKNGAGYWLCSIAGVYAV